MGSNKIGFGIIGCGMISNWHADAISVIEGASLVGASDVNEKSRLAFKEKYKVPVYNTEDELLANPEVAVVCICTPSGLHAPLAIKVAAAKKHIIVEKPMALNLKEADDIISACEQNG